MKKRIFIPLASILIAVGLLLSPIASNVGQPLGQLLHPSGNPFAHTFSDTKDIRTATYVVAASDSEHKYMVDYVCDGVEHELVICDCETAWNSRQGANVVCTADPDHQVGTFSAKMAVQGAAGAGLLATKDFTALDLSDRQVVKIWLKSSVDAGGGLFILHLSSTPDCGDTPNEEEIELPVLAAGVWKQVKIKLANPASDTAIISVGIEMIAFIGVLDLYVDDVKQIWGDEIKIQAAIDALPATGGEVHLLDGIYLIANNLVLDSYQTLRGCGRATCLTSEGRITVITATGTDESEKQGILITDLSILNTGSALNGILWTYVDYSKISNIRVLQFTKAGIGLVDCDYNILTGNTCSDQDGTVTAGINLETSSNNIISSNIANGNNWYGILIKDNSNGNTISGNSCYENDDDAIEIRTSSYNTVVGNVCQRSGQSDICLALSATHNVVIGNSCLEGGQVEADRAGIRLMLESNHNLIASNICRQGTLVIKPAYGIRIDADCDYNIIQGNDLHDAGAISNLLDESALTTVRDDNRGIEITDVKDYVYIKNTSGNNRVAGDVVSLKAVAAGNEFTDPAGVGEDQVLGMLAEDIDNNAKGYVQVLGKTTILKATNVGGDNIAIGNFLCTEAGQRARKAAAGDMAFAIALEVCDAADVTIDALLIVPRAIQ